MDPQILSRLPRDRSQAPGNAADASPLSRAPQPHLDKEACFIHATGDIPCERRGKGHRRARLSDVLTYKETRTARATELDRMREAAADGDLYDLDLSDQTFAHFADAP